MNYLSLFDSEEEGGYSSKKKKEGPPGCAACEDLEFSHASHQCADQPDHHDRRDDPHYHFHDFFHFQVPLRPYLMVAVYEML